MNTSNLNYNIPLQFLTCEYIRKLKACLSKSFEQDGTLSVKRKKILPDNKNNRN